MQITFEHRDIIADEGQRIVDLMGHARDELSQAGELLGLHQAALGRLRVSVGLRAPDVRELLEHDILFLELFLGAHAAR